MATEVKFEVDIPKLPGAGIDIIIEHCKQRVINPHNIIDKNLISMPTDP